MNKTKIDWADMTWNPVTGCLHGCEYCYARKIAERFEGFAPEENNDWRLDTTHPISELDGMQARRQKDGKIVPAPYPFGFFPTFHKYRLNEPTQTKKPQTIFVCSMADLFGEWVPEEWIQRVFMACNDAPQHRYLFLTKNPSKWPGIFQAYSEDETENWWFGQSLETFKPHDYVWAVPKHFISIEPILSAPDMSASLFGTSWVIVGAETGNRKDKIVPEKKWIYDILAKCVRENVPIFMKESLRELMGDDFIQMYPWEK